MPERIASAAQAQGGRAPSTPPEFVRCIVDSLANAYAATVRRAAEFAGRTVEVIHLVGGGSQNDLLCQLTADAAELPVLAGPVEATALGNVLVQARAHGALPASLDGLGVCVASMSPPRRFAPKSLE